MFVISPMFKNKNNTPPHLCNPKMARRRRKFGKFRKVLITRDYLNVLASPASTWLFFFSKMDFTRAQLSQQISNDKDNDQQDVSHLAFFPNSRSVNRLFKFRTFLLGSIFGHFCVVAQKTLNSELFNAPQAYQRSVPD